jgi:hypothetical protein
MTHTEPWPVTPILTDHARERCAEMGIRAKDAKHIWQKKTLTRGLVNQHRVIVSSTSNPDYVLVVDETEERPVIITVLFKSDEEYIRLGRTYRIKDAS